MKVCNSVANLCINEDYKKFQIDIEEYEFSEGGFEDWIKSGALVNVNQIALELHVLHKDSNPRWINQNI